MSTNGRPAPIGELSRVTDEDQPLDLADVVQYSVELLLRQHRSFVDDDCPPSDRRGFL